MVKFAKNISYSFHSFNSIIMLHINSPQLLFAVKYRHALMLFALIVASNWLTYSLSDAPDNRGQKSHSQNESLFLLNEASQYTLNVKDFENKVREVADKLSIPPDWLMAVMHAESRFDASISNRQGSGATGLIQWMPKTIAEYDITIDQLRNLNHVEQLDFAYRYLDDQRKRHGNYQSLTNLYLAILYPNALGKEYCHTLYANPSQAYKMNKGLDGDRDGRVTIGDIDRLLKRKYMPAYVLAPPQNKGILKRVTAGIKASF